MRNIENLDEIHSENFSSSSKDKSKNFDSFNKNEKQKKFSNKNKSKESSDDMEQIRIQKSHKRNDNKKTSFRGYSSIMSKMSSSKLSSGKVYFNGKNSSSIINRLLFPDKKANKGGKSNRKLNSINKNVSIKKIKKNMLKKLEQKPNIGSSFKIKKRTSKSKSRLLKVILRWCRYSENAAKNWSITTFQTFLSFN
jgi:hypothetical protein